MDRSGYLGPGSGSASKGDVGSVHVPVLLQPVLAFLQVQPGGVYIDCTVGGGGHAEAILNASAPDGRLLGLDRDPMALVAARERLSPFRERALLRHGSFAELDTLTAGFAPADGVLLDLGLSSLQLADPSRGFSFSQEGPLDMRFDPTAAGPTAADLVNSLSVKELAGLLYRFGEEMQARRIAEAIVAARPLRTTVELAQVVERAVGSYHGPDKMGVRARRSASGPGWRIHPATRTFQALRMVVNREQEALEAGLPQALEALKPGGRLVVISFHSLEDRAVKHFLRQEARDCICPPDALVCVCGHRSRLDILTPKPVRPDLAEVAVNPRARSARLRAARKR